jgi:hypothetical protein
VPIRTDLDRQLVSVGKSPRSSVFPKGNSESGRLVREHLFP